MPRPPPFKRNYDREFRRTIIASIPSDCKGNNGAINWLVCHCHPPLAASVQPYHFSFQSDCILAILLSRDSLMTSSRGLRNIFPSGLPRIRRTPLWVYSPMNVPAYASYVRWFTIPSRSIQSDRFRLALPQNLLLYVIHVVNMCWPCTTDAPCFCSQRPCEMSTHNMCQGLIGSFTQELCVDTGASCAFADGVEMRANTLIFLRCKTSR